MNERITPYNITELKENEIFVFGSNSCGVHNGNAASTAMKFGAIMGQAAGAQRQTYAIPSRDMENFKKYIDDFLVYAKQHPEYTFLVTEIGCGISGHSPSEIAPLFKEALKMDNIHLPLVFWDILNGGIKGRIRQIAEVEALSVPEFCVRIGIPVTELMNLLFGNADPTIWTIRKILIAFPYRYDVEGIDAMYKLAILSSLAFHTKVPYAKASSSPGRGKSFLKVGALGSPRKLHLFAKASPLGRGGTA